MSGLPHLAKSFAESHQGYDSSNHYYGFIHHPISKGVVNRGARGAKAPPVFQVLMQIFENNFGDF
jgi:hypothetical protein